MGDLLSAKGTIYSVFPSSGRRPIGYFLMLPAPVQAMNIIPLEQVLINDVIVNRGDMYSAVSCLNNEKLMYNFGKAFGDITISGTILMGANTIGLDERLLHVYFEQFRMSSFKKPLKVLAGITLYQFYLTGMGIGGTNPEYHTRDFTFTGVVID